MTTLLEAYNSWLSDKESLLKYPSEIISFIDSCGFDCEQLQRIIRGIEDLHGSDYEDGKSNDFDQYDARRDAELE